MTRVLGAASTAAALLAIHTAVNARRLRTPPTPARVGSTVSVLVPARDEASSIGPCVAALLASEGIDRLEVLVLDDGSTDGTAQAARAAGLGDPRLRVLIGEPQPPGWLGKPHACAQLAEASTGEVLVFVDADVLVAPRGLAATVALLRAARLDLVSPYPRQLADGPGPRLIQPLLQWSWLTFVPLAVAERSSRPSLAVANGQLLACDANAYRRAGGHANVRGEVIEDVALARAFKAAGLRATVADGTDLATCRMYASWADVREGYTKSLWAAFASPLGAVAAGGLLVTLYLWPPLAALRALLRGEGARAAVGALGYAAGVAGRVAAARRTGGRAADALAHPLSIGALLWLLARSWGHKATGRLTWKGRPVP